MGGFLGSSLDWDLFSPKDFAAEALLYLSPKPSISLALWGQSFLPSEKSKNILMGYSLGGRLALHALLAHPSRWTGAILISTHPGLSDPKRREERLQRDQIWADRFLSEPWDHLMKEWNSQPVLASSKPLERKEKNYCRKTLAQMLTTWSLGSQEDLQKPLSELPVPILWVTGEEDHFSMQPKLSHPLSSICSIGSSGHRVPWDAPKPFKTCVASWVQTLPCD